jgi:MFS superfamily sulfate permease-like transporter
LLVGQTIAHYTSRLPKDASPEEVDHLAVSVATILTLQVGLVTFLLGIFRLGFLDAVLSKPLLRGFISAVGCVIFLEQLVPLLGLQQIARAASFSHLHTWNKLQVVFSNLNHAHRLTCVLSTVSSATLITFRIFKPRLIARFRFVQYIPDILLLVIFTTLLTQVFRWDLKGLAILGAVNAKHVKPVLPFKHWRYALDNMGTAALIAVMGFVDSIVAAKENASRYNYSMSPNRELVALGAANIAASFVAGTIPGYGSITRSRLAASTGARTPMAALCTGTAVLLTTYFLLPFLFYLPSAVLSSVILLVVYSILAEIPHDIRFFVNLQAWPDLILMLVTFLLTFFWSVSAGVTISIALSLIMVVQKSSSMSVDLLCDCMNRADARAGLSS